MFILKKEHVTRSHSVANGCIYNTFWTTIQLSAPEEWVISHHKEYHQTFSLGVVQNVLLLPVQVNCSAEGNCWGNQNKHQKSHLYDIIFREVLISSLCCLTGTVVGGAGLVQEGGTENVSRLLFCSKSSFTVGKLLHCFSFGAEKC